MFEETVKKLITPGYFIVTKMAWLGSYCCYLVRFSTKCYTKPNWYQFKHMNIVKIAYEYRLVLKINFKKNIQQNSH